MFEEEKLVVFDNFRSFTWRGKPHHPSRKGYVFLLSWILPATTFCLAGSLSQPLHFCFGYISLSCRWPDDRTGEGSTATTRNCLRKWRLESEMFKISQQTKRCWHNQLPQKYVCLFRSLSSVSLTDHQLVKWSLLSTTSSTLFQREILHWYPNNLE